MSGANTHLSRDQELEAFKRQIDLVDYAAMHGYEICPDKSSRRSWQMWRNGNKKDRIVVLMNKEYPDVFMYFDLFDKKDSGTIIQFDQRENGGNLGHVRKRLRHYLSNPPSKAHSSIIPRTTQNSSTKLPSIIDFQDSSWLNSRGISNSTIEAFKISLKSDSFGQTVFPHIKGGGEQRSKNYNGFFPGADKTLWIHKFSEKPQHIYIFESGLDALSFYQIHQSNFHCSWFISTGGSLSAKSRKILEMVYQKFPSAIWHAAFDNDSAGDSMTKEMSFINQNIIRTSPSMQNADWSDMLQNLNQSAA